MATSASKITAARHARAVRTHGPDSPQAQDALRDRAAARLNETIRDIVSKAPPLTSEQRTALASLLCSDTPSATCP